MSLTVPLLFGVVAAVLGMFQFGYNTGVINSPEAFITTFIKEQAPNTDARFMFSVVVSIFAIGGMIGCPLASWLSDRFGRKEALIFNAAFGILGALLMGLSERAKSVPMLVIGRFLIGINCGFATTASPTYVSETSPVNLRGALGTVNQVAVALGLTLSQVLGIDAVLGSATGWPLLLGLVVVPAAIQCVMLFFAPQSPRYLLLSSRDEQRARQVLTQIRGCTDIDDEINAMYEEDRVEKESEKFTIPDLLRISHLRTPLLIGIVMHLSQQWGGINAVLYYSTVIFQQAGLTEPDARIASIGVGSVLFVMAFVSVFLMDRLGRRTLQLWGLGGMAVFTVLMTVTLSFESSAAAVFSVIFTLGFVAFFGVGPSSIPWMILSEMFTQGARSAAVSVGALVNWFANFVIGISFLSMRESLGNFVFLPFTALLILFFVFTYFKLPETRNKTVEQVAALFKK